MCVCVCDKRKWFHTEKEQEADDIPQKLWQTQTMQMIKYFLQKHLAKANPCCLAWSKQLDKLASTWM